MVTGLSTAEVSRTLGRLLAIELIIGVAVGRSWRWARRPGACGAACATSTGSPARRRRSRPSCRPTGAGLDRRVPVAEEGTEVGQLAESMNTLLAAVETQFAARVESEQRMRQFLADASHELRTPLTSIRGYAELARMQRRRAATPDADDNLDRIESEGTRMSRLVEDLLLLARGDAAGADARPASRTSRSTSPSCSTTRSAARAPRSPTGRSTLRIEAGAGRPRRPRPAAAGGPQPGHQRRRAHRGRPPDPR